MKRFPLWQFLLGVLFGVLLCLVVVRYRNSHHMLNLRYGDWAKLNVVLDLVDGNYVDAPDREKVSVSAINAALSSLDPHSVYLPPVELSESEEQLQGNFDGIGIQFNVPADTAIVIEVIAGGPSEKSGLRKGDRLIKVDDKVIAGVKFPQDSMVSRMRGPSGTKVTVTVKRGREEIPFEITRGKIPVHSVDAAFMITDTTAYIRMSRFARTTYREFMEAVEKVPEASSIIVDLRANAGGYMDQALLLSNEFLQRGDTIVYMEGLHRAKEVYRADGRGRLRDIGLTVLISENSASASEIFAGAMQDNDRGRIIGRRSYGKGLVQEPFFFSDNSGIRLTVARYYTPSGRCIQKPYTGSLTEYGYDIYNRYADGEVFYADSVRLDTTDIHFTRAGRKVYGGGGIMPDVFVPLDTTHTTTYYRELSKKATAVRFASSMMDRYGDSLLEISSFADMDAFLSSRGIAGQFRSYATRRDGISCTDEEWKRTAPYLVPEVYALVSRYSRLGENAFYKYYLPVDTTLQAAL